MPVECLKFLGTRRAHVRREPPVGSVFTATQRGRRQPSFDHRALARACQRGVGACWARARGVLVNVLCHFLEWKQQFSYCGNVRLQQRSAVKRLHSSLRHSLLVFSGCLDWRSTRIGVVKQRLQVDMLSWNWRRQELRRGHVHWWITRKLLVYWNYFFLRNMSTHVRKWVQFLQAIPW